MSTHPNFIDYTATDFARIKQSLIDFIQTRFPNDLTDFSESQMGIILLELFSWVGDMLSYKIDITANEQYLTLAQDRDNIVNLVKLVGYKPRSASAASVSVDLNVNTPGGFPLNAIIAKGSKVPVGALVFENTAQVTIPAGATFISAGMTLAEGESFADTFTSDGTSFQLFQSTRDPVLHDTVEVRVNGVLWTAVDALIFAQSENKYALRFTGDDEAIVEFGNDLTGNKPHTGDVILVSYRVGGGTVGNLAVGAIKQNISATLTDLTPARVYVLNATSATGGADREANDEIRTNAPRVTRTHYNAVTREDYNALINAYSSPTYGTIARGICIPRYGRTNSSANELDIYIWARDNTGNLGPVSAGLKQALAEYLNVRKVVCTDIFMWDGPTKPINVKVALMLDPAYKSPADYSAEVSSIINAFFTDTSIMPGASYRVSVLYQKIMDIVGTMHCFLIGPSAPTPAMLPDVVSARVVVGFTTDITAVTGGWTTNQFANGTLTMTSGALVGRSFPIINNDAGHVTVNGSLAISIADTFTVMEPYTAQADVPTLENEVYVQGAVTKLIYVRGATNRESVLVPWLT